MAHLRTQLWMFCKAQMSSQVASLVDFTVSVVLERLGLWYFYAAFFGALSGGVVNCTVNYRWVFHAQGQKKKYVAIKYFIVWGISILLNTGGTYVLTEVSGVYFLFSKVVVAVLVGVFWNYQMQRLFVFRNLNISNKDGRRRLSSTSTP